MSFQSSAPTIAQSTRGQNLAQLDTHGDWGRDRTGGARSATTVPPGRSSACDTAGASNRVAADPDVSVEQEHDTPATLPRERLEDGSAQHRRPPSPRLAGSGRGRVDAERQPTASRERGGDSTGTATDVEDGPIERAQHAQLVIVRLGVPTPNVEVDPVAMHGPQQRGAHAMKAPTSWTAAAKRLSGRLRATTSASVQRSTSRSSGSTRVTSRRWVSWASWWRQVSRSAHRDAGEHPGLRFPEPDRPPASVECRAEHRVHPVTPAVPSPRSRSARRPGACPCRSAAPGPPAARHDAGQPAARSPSPWSDLHTRRAPRARPRRRARARRGRRR